MMKGRDFTIYGLLTQPDTWFVEPDSPTHNGGVVPDANESEFSQAHSGQLEPLHSLRQANLQSTRRAPGTFSAWKVVKETGSNLFESAQHVAGSLAGSMAANAIAARLPGSPSADGAASGNSGITQALATSMSSAATGFLTKTVSTISKSRLDEKDALRETYIQLVSDSQEKIKQYPKDVQAAINSLDKSVREAFSQESQSVAWHEQKLRHREEILMSVPYYSKDIAQWEIGNERKNEIRLKIKNLVDSYPAENHATLEGLIQRMRANSVSQTPARVQAYLYGPPGTGKTRFVKELADALGLPVIEIRVPSKNLDNLYGYKWSVDYASPNTSDTEIIGELPHKLIKSGYTNPIVFFDELTISDTHVLNGLKVLLDGAKKTIPIESFNIELDWSRATVLCASNDKLSDPALKTRMPQLNFLQVSRDAKKSIVVNKYDATIATYGSALSEKSVLRLRTECINQLDFMLAKDTSPGARDLQAVAESLVHFVAAGLIDNPQKSRPEMRSHILRDFDNMRLEESEAETMPKHLAAAEDSD